MDLRRAPGRKYDPLAQRKRLAAQYAGANREAAEIVIGDPEKYSKGSLLHQWASAILNGPEAAADVQRRRHSLRLNMSD